MANGPRAVVQAPTLTAPKYGLLVSSPPITDNDRWVGGFHYSPDPCPGQGDVIDICTPDTFTAPENLDLITYDPFIIREGFQCSTFGFQANDYEAKARRLLNASQSFHVAREFWTGTWAKAQGIDNVNRYLASPDSDVRTTGPSTPTQALACLEQGLAECDAGQQGMIHATPQIATEWMGLGLVTKEGNLITTVLGTIVVADAGYDGSRWDGAPAVTGKIWAYATGLVQVRLGPVVLIPGDTSSATARATNMVEFQATRPAAVTWSGCCLIAAEINSALCGAQGS